MEIMGLRKAVEAVLKAIEAIHTDPDVRILLDPIHEHYQYARVGWNNGRYSLSILVHMDIIQHRIWVQADNTEFGVVDALVEQGVPQDQIVLGFHAPQHRQYTGFATGSEVAA